MSIRVIKGTATRIVQRRDMFILRVRECDNRRAATEALREVVGQLLPDRDDPRLGGDEEPDVGWGPSYASEIVEFDDGPLVYVDGGTLPDSFLYSLPHTLVEQLRRKGASTAIIDSPAGGGRLDSFPRMGPAAMLVLMAPPIRTARLAVAPQCLPSDWRQIIDEWVLRGPGQADLIGRVVSTELLLDRASVATFIDRYWNDIEFGFSIVALGRSGPVNAATETHPASRRLVLGRSLPSMAAAPLREALDEMVIVARSLASDVAYAFVVVKPTFATFGSGEHYHLHRSTLPRFSEVLGGCDLIVLDAFPYQILGPGHAARLGGVPETASTLPGERFELLLGEPEDWLPDSPTRESTLQTGRELLWPCLLDPEEREELLQSLTVPSALSIELNQARDS